MEDIHCLKCKGLLFKGKIIGRIEIKCRKCGYLNNIDKIGPFIIRIDDSLNLGEFYLKNETI